MRKMKDSGIEWVGQIPEEWDFIRGKYHLANKKYIPGVHADKYDRLSLTLQGVLPRSKDDAEGLQPKDFYTYQLLRKGELVFKLIDLQNVSTSRVGLSYDIGLVSPAYIVLRGDNNVSTEYLQYFYLMMWHREIFNALGDNGVRSNLGATDLLNVSIPVPPLSIQKRIATFLDHKCSEIDALRADIEKEIATLEEYKKSVITEAVTKGLDPNVEMKESGIEWVRKIPKKWDILPLKYLFNIVSGSTPDSTNSELWDGEVPWITPADFKTEDYYVSRGHRNISELGYNSCSTSLVPANSIVFSKRAPIGSVVITKNQLCTNQGCLSCIPKRYDNTKFYYYVMSVYGDIFNLFGSGTTFKEISATVFGNLRFQHPSVEEQRMIVKRLDAICSDIDDAINARQSQINILDDYKESIIYEYVTGKKEVTDEAFLNS